MRTIKPCTAVYKRKGRDAVLVFLVFSSDSSSSFIEFLRYTCNGSLLFLNISAGEIVSERLKHA